MWDVTKAVKYLNDHTEPASIRYGVHYVKRTISAGGDIDPSIESAKVYGNKYTNVEQLQLGRMI